MSKSHSPPEAVLIAAHEKTEIYRRSFSSVPLTIRFQLRHVQPGQAVKGQLMVSKSGVLGRPKSLTTALLAKHQIKAGLFDTFMTICIKVEHDVWLEWATPSRALNVRVKWLVAFVVLLAVLVALLTVT